MIVIYTPEHALHAPAHEIHRGERVPCFETPDRLDVICSALKNCQYEFTAPTVDSTQTIARVHSQRYLDFLKNAWESWIAIDPENEHKQPFPSVWPVRTLRSDREPVDLIARLGLYSMDNGTPMVRGTWAAAKAAADTACTGVECLSDSVKAVFCATRPPGHHAGYDFMGGYSFINNAAVAAEELLQNGCARVCILDLDFHHGNGTQSIFYQRQDVVYISIHGDPQTEYPFFSGYADERGAQTGYGYNLNLPLPAGATSILWFEALISASRFMQTVQPDALVISLGLDTYINDPISRFALQTSDFSRLGRQLSQLQIPTLFVLEGGYAVRDLGDNLVKVLDGFGNQ